MLKVPQILVRTLILVGGAALLAACGQKGLLFLPTEVAARQRATLPQTLRPAWTRTPTTPPSAPGDATAVTATPGVAAPATNVAPPTEAELVPQSTLSP